MAAAFSVLIAFPLTARPTVDAEMPVFSAILLRDILLSLILQRFPNPMVL
jgi:hypothetical protein